MFVNIEFSRISDDVQLGDNVRIVGFVNLYGCSIGENSFIGPFVEIQDGVSIGRRVKIQSHTFICSGVEIGDEVFLGHGVIFTNDKYPRSTNEDGTLQSVDDWSLELTKVGKRATIGSNATILCGVVIGENAMVGAGSVVTKNVPANSVVAGNPAVIIRVL